MKIELKENGEKAVISLTGEIDCAESDEFFAKVMETYEAGKKDIVFDCENLTFIDSTTLGTFVKILKRVKADGHSMSLVSVRSPIMKLFKICSLDTIIDIS
ncbi:MAG: STAS domain-containing protein [Clostridia bacterium]|nr:STAS domain-containing protein [Clostridia bacterium]